MAVAFAPTILTYIYLINFFHVAPQEKIHVYEYGSTAYRFFRKIIMVIIILSGILYVILSIKAVRQYKSQISDLYSNTEKKINLNWSYYLITGIALIWIAVIIKNETLIFTLVSFIYPCSFLLWNQSCWYFRNLRPNNLIP